MTKHGMSSSPKKCFKSGPRTQNCAAIIVATLPQKLNAASTCTTIAVEPLPDVEFPPVTGSYNLSEGQELPASVPLPAEPEMVDATLEPEELFQKFDAEVDRLAKHIGSDSLKLCEVLRKIQQGALYLHGHYKTFEAYCRQKSDFARSTLFQYAKIGRVYEVLGQSTVVDCKPTGIRQLRPLIDVENKEQVIEIWRRARLMGGERITERAVVKAKQTVLGRPDQRSKNDEMLCKDLQSKFSRAIRACWDQWPHERRAVMVFRLLGFIGGLVEELMQEEVFDEQVEAELRGEPNLIDLTKKFLRNLRNYFAKGAQ